MTRGSTPEIISKLEEIAKLVSFKVRKKDCKVRLEGTREGVKGPLSIAAEIFEVTPSLVVVEVKKKGGDKAEYDQFCSTELKPGLRKLMMGDAATSSHSAPELSLLPSSSDSEMSQSVPSDTELEG